MHLLGELYPRYGPELEQQMKKEALTSAMPRITGSRATQQLDAA